jgi:hypothetical protein
MRADRVRLGLVAAATVLPCGVWADAALAGRWQGSADLAGEPLPLVIDIAPAPGAGAASAPAWIGSAILPGRGVKGAPLADLVVGGGALRFSLADALAQGRGAPPIVQLSRDAAGRLVGELRLGTLAAPVRLERTGQAQVDLPVPATALTPELTGIWVGRYELGGYPRDVTLTLANGAGGLGGGELVIVGKRRSQLVIDHVVQGRAWVTLTARAASLRIEGRHTDGTISGRFVQGPFEAPLVLRRAGAEGRS